MLKAETSLPKEPVKARRDEKNEVLAPPLKQHLEANVQTRKHKIFVLLEVRMRGVPEHDGLVVLERSTCSGDVNFVTAGAA